MMKDLLSKSQLYLKRNAPTILTCAGGVGVVATAVTAVKATPKAMRLLEAAEEVKGEELTKLEKARIAGPIYIPSIAIGVSTIVCIFGANALNQRQQAAITSAYALVNNSYKEYKKKIEELYGEEANDIVVGAIAKDKYEDADIPVEDEKELFYDDFSGRYFRSTIEDVQQAEYQINRDLIMRDYATLNEFYDWLELPHIDAGDTLGWSTCMNFDYYWQTWIDFTHSKITMEDGTECHVIRIVNEPLIDYEEYC